ncbi:VacJ family lipoprotein [Phaeobacter sp. J2-8]|uniref:MlaA family lipoprotein n=1 Tax=Phaeobacter sp. J2-8 TaxID=2931394 RepID=UPI001FD05C66|nr:VacJ family lipoprotein [Phaeobacter sp. J2-8]MCJ7871092.1 VacJ family lipoprotein [Phaeobacter sp. J2-8]
MTLLSPPRTIAIAALVMTLIAGCTPHDPTKVSRDGIFDPYEARNRQVHEKSKNFDKSIVRSVAVGYAETVPEPAQEMVENFADNLSVPSAVVNQVLQADLGGAFKNTVRFGLNSTLGFAGIFDVAGEFGLHEDDADFGQTLAVWGVREGAYLEMPIIGPTTERDLFGQVVDLVIDPMNAVPRPEAYYLKAARITAKVGKRGRYASSVDSVLYDSADSYAQTRLLYLQNRRYEIGQTDVAGAGGGAGGEEIDPYAELYGGEIDPYEDLYGE